MAIEPKSPRKRAAKKTAVKDKSVEVESSTASTSDSTKETTTKTRKKAAAIPVPVFQAAPVEKVARLLVNLLLKKRKLL